MNVIILWIAGVSCAVWVGAYVMLQILDAVYADSQHKLRLQRKGFWLRNRWRLLMFLPQCVVFYLFLSTDSKAGPAPLSQFESACLSGLVLCGAVLWLIYYDIADVVGTKIERMAEPWLKNVENRMRLMVSHKGEISK